MGVVLFVVRKWSDCAILLTAILFLLQPVEWYHYIVSLFDPSHTLPDLGVGPMYQEVAAYTKEGNFGEFIWGNITLGQKASLYWALGAGRFWQTAGLFLMGLYIGRKQLFVPSFLCHRICSVVSVERIGDGKWQSACSGNSRNGFRYVAEVCIHGSAGCIFCVALSKGRFQEVCVQSSLLWKNEFE